MSTIIIKNNLISKKIRIIVDNELYYVKCGDIVKHKASKNNVDLKISIDKKDKISFKWFNVLFTEAIASDAKSILFFDYTCNVIIGENDLNIVVLENNYRKNDSLMLSSVSITSSEKCVNNEQYSFSNEKVSPKMKHAILQLLFLSGLPLIIAGLIYLIFNFEIGVFIACIILFLIATIPSIKAIRTFNNTFDNGADLLSSEIENRCDYDKIEYVANEIISENEKGPLNLMAKIIKQLLK